MSNRDPKLCAQAVQGFWNNERELIRQGQGTRNWSVQEQIEIMNFKPSGGERKNAAAPTYGQGELGEKGMNYDKYEGHHMKSAEAHTDLQSDPNNIQALTRAEHQQAHDGNFQNPTYGYYDHENGSLQPQQLSEAYVHSAEYQYIQDSINEQQGQEVQATEALETQSTNEGLQSFYEKTAESQSTDTSQISENEGIAAARARMAESDLNQDSYAPNEGIESFREMTSEPDQSAKIEADAGQDLSGSVGETMDSGESMDAGYSGGMDMGGSGGDGGQGME